ncbi:hypothetical protein [Providencia sp. PROV036]|uniref:hypothetical protein n=1 Tax=Providencia sp. PROV036 TaxID=2949767 RepID=UPI002349FFC6|nr:hypothetical protein [Providencia sp. PROV036]
MTDKTEVKELMASDMTLRDRFAIATFNMAWQARDDGYYEGSDEDVAECAYQIADAMLKARG